MSATPATIAPDASGIRFPVASRPQMRFSNTQTISNLTATSFQPIPLPATGFVRRVTLDFCCVATSASDGAVVNGDGPWNLISAISLSDATGQPVYQPISGYNLYTVNKYFPMGGYKTAPRFIPFAGNPQMGPEYAFASTATTGTARFRLDLDFEQSSDGYGCLPNLDSNSSLLLKIDLAAVTVAFSGTTMSASNMSVRVTSDYWAPIGATTGAVPNQTAPNGFGDYLQTRYETQTVTAAAENTINVNNRGGMVRGMAIVSRAAGVRTAYTAASNVGLVYDNNAINEGIPLEEWQDRERRITGYLGADLGVSYAPLTAGVLPGLDDGVIIYDFDSLGGGRDTWLNTRVGTLEQVKLTPGATATQLEIITLLAQVKDSAAFYGI